MKRLYQNQETMRKLFSDEPIMVSPQPVPYREGTVVLVRPVTEVSQSIESYLNAVYAAAEGCVAFNPRVALRFRLLGIDREVVARIPGDAQYALKPGEKVVVYSYEFDESSKKIPKSSGSEALADLTIPYHCPGSLGHLAALADLGILDFPDSFPLKPMPQNRLSKLIEEEQSSKKPLPELNNQKSPYEEKSLREDVFIKPDHIPRYNIKKIIPKKDLKHDFIRIDPKFLEDESTDPFKKPKRDPTPSLKEILQAGELLRDLKSHIPISVQGMQVLDENGDVRFQAVCEAHRGLEYR